MLKIYKFQILFLSAICLSGMNLHAQDSITIRKIASFSKNFISFSKDYPQEKVYLHFDNSAYFLGETLWFKGYIVSADRNALSQMSKTLYVELISQEGNVIETKKVRIENGQCHGDFKIPSTNYAGFYEVRAYTRYMLNFDQANTFSRVFPVYDKPVETGDYKHVITARPLSQRIPQLRKEYNQKETLNLSFFPEGGNLISGLKQKVAFKATGKNGENAAVTGSVYDDKGKLVVDFSTDYQDMGVFEFTPNVGKYTIKAQYQNKEYSFILPQALPTGYALNINSQDEDKIDILIQKNALTATNPLGLSISCRGKLYGFEQVSIGKENALLLSFNKKMLPTGITQITLYNISGEVLSERLVFVNHNSQMKIELTQDKEVYKPFEKVDMYFLLSDFKGKPVETSFSVAVHDNATTTINPFNDNILTNLLLSSEVKGYIENPGFYFQSNDPARRQALDLLLLTQGWSRYSWKQMAGASPFTIKQPIEKQLVIEGSVTSLILKKKKENIDISMVLMNDSLSQKGTCKTDKNGEFNFGLQDFNGQANLLLQSKENDKRTEKNILLYRYFTPEIKMYSFAELNITDYVKALRDSIITNDSIGKNAVNKENSSMSNKNHLLQEILVKAKKKNDIYAPVKVNITYKVDRELDKLIDTGDWSPADLFIFLEKMNKYYNSASGMYKGKKVMFVKDNSMQLISGVNSILSGVDNTQTSDLSTSNANQMSSNNTGNPSGGNITGNNQTSNNSSAENDQVSNLPRLDEIESISVIEDMNSIIRIAPQIDANTTVLIILHSKKDFHKEPMGIRETKYDGYAYVKEFYSPRYDKVLLPDEKDYRRTIYWNPDVKTDQEGKASIIFFNNSTCKTMNVSAETVTTNGILGVLNK